MRSIFWPFAIRWIALPRPKPPAALPPTRLRCVAGCWRDLETRTSAEYCFVEGQVRRSKKLLSIRGLNKDHNHDLKGLFKGAATMASVRPGPFQDFYQAALAKGIKPTNREGEIAERLTVTQGAQAVAEILDVGLL
jgi:hypothetical protein